jgi:hypothetical protein
MSETAQTASAERRLTIPEVGELRRKTEAISELLRGRLAQHLDTLRTLLAPRRLLGRHLGGGAGRDDVQWADRALHDLQAQFKEVCGPPFVLKPEIGQAALSRIENRPELYPWEYDHTARAGTDDRTICIRSPARWVLTYGSDYSFAQLRQVMAGKGEKRSDDIRQFLLNALVMKGMLDRFTNLGQLLTDLRFEVSVETSDRLGKLPLVVLSSHLTSFLPSDDLVLAATGFSGVNEFIELIDRDAVQGLRDPLREQLERSLG